MRLKCIRSQLDHDGKVIREKEETHIASVQWIDSLSSLWVKLTPGVTGYESICVGTLLKDKSDNKGWSACAGTGGSWDKLFVPAEEMERLKDFLRLLPEHEKE